MLSGAIAVSAQSSDELEEEIQDRSERIDELEEEINKYEVELQDTQEEQ
jgi:prefoldin subunit 5